MNLKSRILTVIATVIVFVVVSTIATIADLRFWSNMEDDTPWERLIVKPYRHIVFYDGLEGRVMVTISGQCQATYQKAKAHNTQHVDVTCQTGPDTYVTDHLLRGTHVSVIVHTGLLTESNKWTKTVTYPYEDFTLPSIGGK